MKVGSLFTGIGGFDLGFIREGFEIAWMCESNPHAVAVLEHRFPGVPIYRDIRDIGEDTPHVDVLIGGFPCQDISGAGKRKGIEDGEKSGLWREFIRVIRTLRPRYVVVENVYALLTPHRKERKPAPIGRVLGDLAESGYDAEWEVLSAEAVGAPHLRERVFIVAYPNGTRCETPRNIDAGQVSYGENTGGIQSTNHPGRSGETDVSYPRSTPAWMEEHRSGGRAGQSTGTPQPTLLRQEDGETGAEGVGAGGADVPDPIGDRPQEVFEQPGVYPEPPVLRAFIHHGGEPARWRDAFGKLWETEPDVGRVVDGVPLRVERLTRLGNAVVPQVAQVAAQAVKSHAERSGVL